MQIEAELFAALKSLVANRVYRDVAPANVTATPWITFQQVGGAPVNFVDPTIPSMKNGRFQVNVWAASRDEAAALQRQVEDALRAATQLRPTVLTGAVAIYEEDTNLYGTRQDFSFWFAS